MLSSLGELKNKCVCVTNVRTSFRNSEGNGVEKGPGGGSSSWERLVQFKHPDISCY